MTHARITVGGIRQMYDATVNAYAGPRRREFQAMSPHRVTNEPVSAAFADHATVTYLGDKGNSYPECTPVSEIRFRFNKPAEAIYERICNIMGDTLPYMRGGGPYFAGAYANKQVLNWTRPGHKANMIEDAFELYRMPYWQDVLKAKFLQLMALESDMALDALTLAQQDAEYYIVADKPPSTGTGYRGMRTRADAAKQIADGSAIGMIEHDIGIWKEGQQEIWSRWPHEGVWVSGYVGYKGTLAGSRSDCDVVAMRKDPDGSYVQTVECTTRGVNITPVSLLATKHTFSRHDMTSLLVKWSAPGYTIKPQDVLRHVFEAPPCTCTFETDKVNIGGDFGYTTPSPRVVGSEDRWHIEMPKETDKSGADAFIGLGCGNIGCTGILTPEYSSGRWFTRLGYEVLCDWNVAHYAEAAGVRPLFMTSLGDDQNVTVKYGDVPYIMNTILAKHLRLKGSNGNCEFRYGKQCVFDSPDHVYVFNMPRAIKTVTSAARAASEVSSLLAGETAELSALPHAIESAAKTWEIAPDVFFMEGNPKEIGDRILSREYQGMLKDAIIAGAIDAHTATYVGYDIDE